MSRLAAMEKGEYYPTPISVIEHIATYLNPPETYRGVIRLFDPCAGEGLALEALGSLLRRRTNRPVQTWGVEISAERAAEAATRLDRVVDAPLETVAWSPVRHGIASLLFLNPPYDTNDRGGRMELDFLKTAMPSLVKGGVLVYLIPTTSVESDMANFLVQHFEDIRYFRFGDEEGPAGFDAFKQIVVIAKKREKSLERYDVYAPDNRDVVEAFLEHCCSSSYYDQYVRNGQSVKDVLSTSLPPDAQFIVPIARKNANLRRERYLDGEMEALASRTWCVAQAQIAEALLGSSGDNPSALPQPLVELKTGHIAQVVASGLMGVVEADGQIFKGRTVKSVVVSPHPEDPEKEIHQEVWNTHIVSVSLDGLAHYTKPREVEEFLQDHITLFKHYIAANLKPYGNTITPEENAILDTLSLDKQLPGVGKRGLLPHQRKTAVALTRSIDRYGVGHLVGEMGYGKTRTSLAAVELMDAYPALVICPPHLYPKWVREAEASVPGLRAVHVNSIEELERTKAEYEPGEKLVVVIKRSTIKLGPGWEKTAATRYTLSKHHKHEAERRQFAEAMAVYKEIRERLVNARKQGEIVDYLTYQAQAREARQHALQAARSYPVCPDCGAPLSKEAQKTNQPVLCRANTQVWNADEMAMDNQRCGCALFEFGSGRYRRWPLADFIRKKMKGFFKALLADEVHQYKAKGSDQGWAFHLLAETIPAVITLTGTFFGGPSSSILYLLYRTQANVRQDFGFDEESRWIRRFGVMEMTFKVDEDKHGKFSGQKRHRVSTKERPGISPGVVRYTLPTTIFASVKDLGVEMPSFREDFVVFNPTKQMESDLDSLHRFTWDQLKTYWPHYTSAWLQWNLARPNACFRHETVEGYDEDKLDCPALVNPGTDQLLPKEAWLVSTIKAEIAAGRKVVIYVRQTGTRDIRQRLVDVLTEAGIPGVAVLKSSIAPPKREAWLKKHPSNVLITNPRLVETGLDLVQFSTAIFYEPDYSLYTMWQACRRVWRLGQTKPVKVYYLSYAGTLEETAYALIGQKIKAAQLLYGDEVSSALVEDPGDASLVMALIKAIENGEDVRMDRTTLFSDDRHVIVDSAVGSLTQASLSVFEKWAQDNGFAYQEVKPKPRARRRTDVPKAQMTLF